MAGSNPGATWPPHRDGSEVQSEATGLEVNPVTAGARGVFPRLQLGIGAGCVCVCVGGGFVHRLAPVLDLDVDLERGDGREECPR